MNTQRRAGLLLSYANFGISIAGNLLLTPALIASLGDEAYSLYQVMRSLGGMLLMCNLGVSVIVARSAAHSDEQARRGALALGQLLCVGLAVAAALISRLISLFLPALYGEDRLAMARRLFNLFAAASVLHILTDAFAGCIIGRERFTANALIVTGKYLLRFGLMYGLIQNGAGVEAAARVDMAVNAFAFASQAGYALGVLRERPRLSALRHAELGGMLSFSSAVLLQEAVVQCGAHLDPILLRCLGVSDGVITMYASALMIHSLYHQLVSMIGGYYLAQASRMVARQATGAQLTDMLILPGRFQAVMAVGAMAGFALFGRGFIALWIGERYLDAYGVALLLMLASLPSLVQTAALSILDAQLKRMHRSLALLFSLLCNVALSALLVPRIGFRGAAIGAAIAALAGPCWLMNRFYIRRVGLDIPRLYRAVFQPVLLPALVSALASLPLTLLPRAWPAFIAQCAAFCLIYALALRLHARRSA